MFIGYTKCMNTTAIDSKEFAVSPAPQEGYMYNYEGLGDEVAAFIDATFVSRGIYTPAPWDATRDGVYILIKDGEFATVLKVG